MEAEQMILAGNYPMARSYAESKGWGRCWQGFFRDEGQVVRVATNLDHVRGLTNCHVLLLPNCPEDLENEIWLREAMGRFTVERV